ncbi:MAG: hypothetical protein JWM33_2066 [Caulobacteraceae bacterium]|nr:hypothetical protein [Caulobacteraceae bacterium]
MARKPNYQLERMDRERAKASKAAKKAEALERGRESNAPAEPPPAGETEK